MLSAGAGRTAEDLADVSCNYLSVFEEVLVGPRCESSLMCVSLAVDSIPDDT